jgi:glutamate synthase (NADPH/NADH) small chain
LIAACKVMQAEGIVFKTGVNVGKDITGAQLKKDFDAIVLAVGATKGARPPVPGRELKGVHLAMEFPAPAEQAWWRATRSGQIKATGKHVIVIGGGDTGSDCIGTSNRHGAASVTNFELLAMPTKDRPANQPWPYYPMRCGKHLPRGRLRAPF